MVQMTHWERVRTALRGKEVDRLPVSMWRHFFKSETSPNSLAKAMLDLQNRFDWDFMKVNPCASYHIKDSGVKTNYDGDTPPKVVDTPIKTPDDWLRLRVLDINRGVLREHLSSLGLIARKPKGELTFVMTVFTPLSIAGRLIDSEEMVSGKP